MSATVPARLVAIRTLKGWSLNEAAKVIGIPVGTLRKFETGTPPPLVELVRIADAYGTSLDYICNRKESALERFASASPDLQRVQLNSIVASFAQRAQELGTLQLIDELVTMLAHELPGWPSLPAYCNAAEPERIARLQSLAQAVARLSRDQAALKAVGALVLRFARSAYSLEREEAALGHQLNALAKMFGRTDGDSPPLTPSRYKVAAEPRPGTKPRAKANRRRATRKK